MKKIITILMTALMLLFIVASCTTKPKEPTYDKNQVLDVVNRFVVDVARGNYESAKNYYKDGETYELISFASLIHTKVLNKALLEGTISYTITDFDKENGIIILEYVYEATPYHIYVDTSDYKIFLTEEATYD